MPVLLLLQALLSQEHQTHLALEAVREQHGPAFAGAARVRLWQQQQQHATVTGRQAGQQSQIAQIADVVAARCKRWLSELLLG